MLSISDRILEALFSPLRRAREEVENLRADNAATARALPGIRAREEKTAADSAKLCADAADVRASAAATRADAAAVRASAALAREAAAAAIAALYPQPSVITSFRDAGSASAKASSSGLISTIK